MNIKSLFTTFVVFALMGSTIVMTGCFGGEDLEEPISKNYETLTGEFKSLGSIKVNKMITHMFETDEGEIFYAYSDRYDLDDDEYFGLRVEAYGVAMEYETLDKDLFEVRRITEADDLEDEDEEVTNVDYKDTDLGVSFTYPDNWTLTSLRDGIELEAPAVELDEENDEDSENEDSEDTTAEEDLVEIQPDYVIISSIGDVLSTTADDEDTARADDIKSYISGSYENFIGVTAQNSYIGEDQVFSLRYKNNNGDTSYFVPRGTELFELSFFHPEEEAYDKLKNSNTFSEIVSTFRFLPYGDEELEEIDDEDDTNNESSDELSDPEQTNEQTESNQADEPNNTKTANTAINANSEDYLTFESNPYNFKIAYFKSWYYSGGNGGYDFNNEPIEDDTDPLIRLDLNAKKVEGESTSGDTFTITVLVDDRYYTLSGPSEYSDMMRYMADSITTVDSE